MIRVGNGYDSHRFTAGRKLILGGIEIPHTMGLDGHSDADAVAHALTDAVLGAVALGDIGSHFPDTDPQWSGADSMKLLAAAVELVQEQGWRVGQCDITVITQAPKIGPHVEAMRTRIAGTIGVGPGDVSVKAKTNEGMGWIGRGEGLAVIATATVLPIDR